MDSRDSLVVRYSPARQRIYRFLLDHASEPWSVAKLQDAMNDSTISVNSLRAVIYVLLSERIVGELSGYRALTVKLTEYGGNVLAGLLAQWPEQRVGS